MFLHNITRVLMTKLKNDDTSVTPNNALERFANFFFLTGWVLSLAPLEIWEFTVCVSYRETGIRQASHKLTKMNLFIL